ncbi:MAG TPA: tRNA (adenosine(37)-N6)-threonylcarbamoyltransferase complex dimerization subunit type 1 TsaB [Bacilli bacterium]|nr:tRNA (adenosine(37)-N6)-threonylcarbamoyltransferase complex dimerization subunit type 1 TsaB [Bacilli bacterium]
MYSLFIDTHNNLMVVGLYKNSQVLEFIKVDSNQSHSNKLLPTIKDLLAKNKLLPADIKEVIVVNGPGSFTGVRIGVTVAKTFAYALNIKIKTITSLEQKAVSSNKNFKVCVENDKNGYFVGIFKDNKLTEDMFYLDNKDFKEYVESNHYEEDIIDEIELDYQKIYDYLKERPYANYHEIKPSYVKKIEVLND